MKTNHLIELADSNQTIPAIIETTIMRLFSVDRLDELDNNAKKTLTEKVSGLFTGTSQTDYTNSHKEYTLFYLPSNFYKVWRPLIDLLKFNLIKPTVNILELGVGPGSCTFGIIEFYRMLAQDNPTEIFNVSFCLVEREKEFIHIFYAIYNEYQKIFPSNLCVSINQINADINEDISFDTSIKFDIIVESNMLNSNEQVSSPVFKNVRKFCKENLREHSSIILIEPADEKIRGCFQIMKQDLLEDRFTIFSPCSCSLPTCKQFTSAKTYIGNSKILSQLRNFPEFAKLKKLHYFEYAILRNDGLKKFPEIHNGILLKDVASFVGQNISFKAYIIATANRTDEIGLKVCDGSFCEKTDIWVNIPKSILIEQRLKEIDANRGEFVEVKNAVVAKRNSINCDIHTRIRIKR